MLKLFHGGNFMKHNDILSENIKSYRKKNNLKQTELAKQLNVSRQVLSGYETGKAEPNLAFLIKLSKLMNCSIDSLLGLDENYILKFPFDTPNTTQPSSNLTENDDIYELIKSLKYLIKKNKTTYKELTMSKKRTDRMLEQLALSKRRSDRVLNELIMSKKRFDIMFNELNRTFNREERFSELLKKLDNIYNNITTVKEETSDELTPEIDLNNSSYIDKKNINCSSDSDTQETVLVPFFDERIAAGEPIGYSDYPKVKPMKLKARYPLTPENALDFYVLKVEGNSMNKIVADGEYILVRATNYVENGSIAVVNIVPNREGTLKHYYYNQNTGVTTLKPDSYDPKYTDLIYDDDDDDVIVQGKYVGKVSDFL